MQATANKLPQREKGDQARARAIVRFNGLLFYGLAAASFLETAAPLHADRLARIFATRPEVGRWLEQSWCPRCTELGRRLRDFIAATWPEFDWDAAYQEFHERYRRGPAQGNREPGIALEAMGLCVASTQAAVFYRALARGADEPALRELARQAAQAHAGAFDHASALFERCARYERVGLLTAWRALHTSCRSARDFDVRVAFEPLARHWRGASTVPELAYGDFRLRMAALIERHAALGRTERLLFRPWLAREPSAPVTELPGNGVERRPPMAQRRAAA
jgi:hypothetical protein